MCFTKQKFMNDWMIRNKTLYIKYILHKLSNFRYLATLIQSSEISISSYSAYFKQNFHPHWEFARNLRGTSPLFPARPSPPSTNRPPPSRTPLWRHPRKWWARHAGWRCSRRWPRTGRWRCDSLWRHHCWRKQATFLPCLMK